MTTTPTRRGRPPSTLLGITAEQWASALGDTSDSRLRRARSVLAGDTGPTMGELVAVAEKTGVAVASIVAELARRQARPARVRLSKRGMR